MLGGCRPGQRPGPTLRATPRKTRRSAAGGDDVDVHREVAVEHPLEKRSTPSPGAVVH